MRKLERKRLSYAPSDMSVTTIARWPKAWRVDQPVDECVYVREGRPRDPLNHSIQKLAQGCNGLWVVNGVTVFNMPAVGRAPLEAGSSLGYSH